MQVINGIRNLPSPLASSILTIGNFDGVHLGHRALINRVVSRAAEKRVPSAVMTFEPHPVKVLYPDRHLHRIFDLDDQFQELEKLGVDLLVIEPFSREFSQLDPERYLLEWIYRPFVPETLVVGYDFSFGANRRGSIDFLQKHAPQLGSRVEVVPPVKVGAVLVSSTRIRQAMEVGDVALARDLLGRPFHLKGVVEKGAGRGRTIGVPTANLHTSAETLPARGVYAAWAEVWGQRWKAAVNIGLNPTFQAEAGGRAMSVEAHLIGFGSPAGVAQTQIEPSVNLYGETVRLEFIQRLRSEKKFNSVGELVSQIRSDVESAEKILSETK